MTGTKNLKIFGTALVVPALFSTSLMAAYLLSIPPFFLGLNERFTYGIGGSSLALLIIYILIRIEKKSHHVYFLTTDKRTLLRFAKGAASGLVIAICFFLAQAWYSGLVISPTNVDLRHFTWMSLSLIPLAFMEELAFRSYPFFKLRDAYGVWPAQIVIAILFALYHYIGGWSLFASFAGPGVWSFAFGLLALRSNGVALPTGFHFGLNLALAIIGNKYWIPAVCSIDFATDPTEEMLESNEYFGAMVQFITLVALLIFTYRYTHIRGKQQSN